MIFPRSLAGPAAIVVCCVLALFWIDRYGKGSRSFGAVAPLGAAQADKKLVDHPVEAYRVWKEGGYRGRAVVFVSGSWPSFLPGERIPEEVYRGYPLKLYNLARKFEEEQLDRVTFLYVAALNGIARKIVALVPEDELERQRALARKAKDHRETATSVYVTREGFPRWFYTAAGFPGLDEPALLYVGASYFKDREPEDLFRQLKGTGLRIDSMVLCSERDNPVVTAAALQRLARFARLAGMESPLPPAPATPVSLNRSKAAWHTT